MAKRLLSTQRIVNLSSNPASGTAGEIYYNTSFNELRVYDGSSWIAIGSGGGGGGGSTITTADVPPASPSLGDMWLNTTSLKTYIYYDSTWVEIGAQTMTGAVSTDVALSNSWWLGV